MKRKMKKVSLFVTICLMLSLVAMPVLGADSYEKFSGSGTSDDPFLIQSEQDFYNLIDATNDNTDMAKYYVGADGTPKYFKFTKDLDMTDYPVNGFGIGITGSWGLLAISSHFDGGGYTISNLSFSNACDMLGVFGQVSGGSVKNFTFDNLTITSTSAFNYGGYVGLLIADTRSNAKVDGCTVKNSTLNIGTPGSNITVGGICGNSNGIGFSNCYTYNNTYPDFTGKAVTFGSLVGGPIASSITCYTDLQPIASNITPTVAYTTVNNYNVGEHGKLLEVKKGTDITREVNGASVVEALDHYYTVVPDQGYTYTVTVNGNLVTPDENNQFTVYAAALNTITVTFEASEVTDDPYGKFVGKGTLDEPYLIRSEQDFYNLIDATNDNTDMAKYYIGADGTPKYFKFTRDLDMTDYPVTGYGIGISGAGWNATAIKSHFDGGGYTISNLSMTNDAMFVGLFGQVEGGSVENLTLDRFMLTSTNTAGNRVAFLAADTRSNAVIRNCSVLNSTLSILAVDGMTVGGLVANSNGIGFSNCNTFNNTYPDFTGKSVTFGSLVGGSIASSVACYTDLQPIASDITPTVTWSTVNHYNFTGNGTVMELMNKTGAVAKEITSGASVVEAYGHTYTVIPDEGYDYTVTVNDVEITPDENNQFVVNAATLNTINVTFTEIPQIVSNTIKAGEGTVTIGGTDYTGTQTISDLMSGETLSFTIKAPENKIVDTIFYNGQNLGNKVDYVTIVKDATLEITYRDEPSVATPAIVIYDKTPLNTEPTAENSYSTHTVYAQISGWALVSDYGMELKNETGDTVALPGLFTAEVLNSLAKCEGKFAVKVYGDGINGRTCTITPYLVYNEETLYGESSEEFTGSMTE